MTEALENLANRWRKLRINLTEHLDAFEAQSCDSPDIHALARLRQGIAEYDRLVRRDA